MLFFMPYVMSVASGAALSFVLLVAGLPFALALLIGMVAGVACILALSIIGAPDEIAKPQAVLLNPAARAPNRARPKMLIAASKNVAAVRKAG